MAAADNYPIGGCAATACPANLSVDCRPTGFPIRSPTMTTTIESTESRPAEAIGRIGKHWGWMLAFGILTIAAGTCALAWPGITLLAAAIPGLSLMVMVFLIGAWLIFFGLLQTALALRLRSAAHSARSWVATPRGAM
jgi:uncharacterized membrane protein HdeD (DUF308 family)